MIGSTSTIRSPSIVRSIRKTPWVAGWAGPMLTGRSTVWSVSDIRFTCRRRRGGARVTPTRGSGSLGPRLAAFGTVSSFPQVARTVRHAGDGRRQLGERVALAQGVADEALFEQEGE